MPRKQNEQKRISCESFCVPRPERLAMSIAGCEEKAALERRGFRPNFLVIPR